ncbi:MAG: VOC family protein [Armatimonadota bacterium]
MKFGYTIVYARDVASAVSLYEAAFGLRRRFIHEGGQYAEMETGQTTLAFASLSLAKSNVPTGFRANDPFDPPAGIEIALTTPDVETAFKRAVSAGAASVAEPQVKPWGQTVAYVRDLDGVLVEIASAT